jgi:hypothetical protein
VQTFNKRSRSRKRRKMSPSTKFTYGEVKIMSNEHILKIDDSSGQLGLCGFFQDKNL